MSNNPFLDQAGIAPPPPSVAGSPASTPIDIGAAADAAEAQFPNLPKGIMRRLIHVESRGNPSAVSDQGAIGLTQLEPSTARALGVDPTDPVQNIVGGARYLSEGIDKTGSLNGGLMYYHGGPDQSGWGPKTQAYPGLVLGTESEGPESSAPNQTSAPNPFMQAAAGSQPSPLPATQPPATPTIGQQEPGWGRDIASLTPVTNALVNGGSDKLGAFGRSTLDADAGLINGAAHVPGSMLNLAADAINATGYGKATADTLHRWGGNLDNLGRAEAFNPDSGAFKAASLAGSVAATAPVSEIKLLEGIPALGRVVDAREGLRALGDVAPLGARMAAALGRYGDTAIQGGAAGALASGGQNMGRDALYGALGAPVIGAAAEKVLAPVAGKAADVASALLNYGRKDSGSVAGAVGTPIDAATFGALRKSYPEMKDLTDQQFADVVQRSRQTGQVPMSAAAADDSGSAVPQTIRTGSQLAGKDFLPAIKAPPGVAQFDEDGAPLVGFSTMDDGRKVPNYGVAGQPGSKNAASPEAVSPAPASSQITTIPANALGSRGARTGIEGHDQMPLDVAAIYKPLVAEGIAPDEALREADIRAVGGSPTAADVTRNPAMMTAVKEGAKSDTVEGQALNLQQAQNNAALHSTLQDAVSGFGGAPAPGEAMETAAESLSSASQAEKAKVSDLYKQADAEAAAAKGVSDTETQAVQDRADLETGLAAQLAARQKLDAAQEAYRTARTTTGADSGKARAALEKARAAYREVSDAPPKAAPVARQKAAGYIDLSSLRAALKTPELSNPTTEGGKSMRNGVLGLMDAYKAKGDLYTAKQAEALRQAVGDAFDPMGGSINHHVGNLKGVIDQAMDAATAGPAYKQARAAHKAWADKYENPEGIAKLIRTDAKGNLVHDDAWRSVENLVGAKNDRPLIQIVNRLKANGDTATVGKLKALVVQDAYEFATGRGAGTATDQLGNSVFSGNRFHARLNTIGMNKLRALFSPSEIAKLASIGRAGVAINEAVPGTVNTSHTAMAITNALRTLNRAEPGKAGKAFDAVMHVGAPIMGAVVHGGAEGVGAGLAADMVQKGVRVTADALAKRKAASLLAENLKRASDPAEVRTFERQRAQRLAQELQRHATAGRAGQVGGRTAAVSSNR